MKTDLHKSKTSHMSVPITKGLEFHLDRKDSPKGKLRIGDKTEGRVPMEVTSIDKGHTRYKQVSKLKMIVIKKQNNKLYKAVKKVIPNYKTSRTAK